METEKEFISGIENRGWRKFGILYCGVTSLGVRFVCGNYCVTHVANDEMGNVEIVCSTSVYLFYVIWFMLDVVPYRTHSMVGLWDIPVALGGYL